MKRLLFALSTILLLAACQKEVTYDNPLALSAVRNELSATEGSTPVIVFTNEEWTAYLPANCDWAVLEKASGSGRGEFIFKYKENYAAARKVVVTVIAGQHKTHIDMVQKSGADKMVITFPFSSISVAKVSGEATVPFTTNIYESEMSKVKITAADQNGVAIDWIRNITVFGDRLRFTVDANTGDASRKAVIKFDYTDDFGTQLLKSFSVEQTTAVPTLTFDKTAVGTMYSPKPTKVKLPFTSNLGLYLPQLLQSASSSQKWAVVGNDGSLSSEIMVDIDANDGAARVSRIAMSYTDNEGGSSAFECLMVQKAFIEDISMADLKAEIKAEEGEMVYNKEGMLEAVVIGDCTNPNIETNPNLKTNDIDYTLNWRTSYLQTVDGTSGIRVVFDRALDNTLKRGDKVYVDLAGLTLVKEANPTRYTLKGLKSSSVSVDEMKADVVVRPRKLGELTDDDVYTAVCLQGLEFTFKHGAYTNAHEGYQRQLKLPDYSNVKGEPININGAGVGYYFSDCTPCSLRDAEGNDIYALINNETPWRRYGNGVPQGTCDIDCIITHTDLARWAYKGWLGRYQIRILDEKDIRNTGAAFSKIVIEWNWGENAALLSRDEAVKPTTPSDAAFYSITSNLDNDAKAKFNRTTTDNMCDFNNLSIQKTDDTKNAKGYVKDGSVHWYRNGIFWAGDDSADMSKAPWFCFGFSTAGLSGTSLVFNWTTAQGAGWGGGTDVYAPALWQVEYSTDGDNFTTLDTRYAIHPIVRYNTGCAGFAINGLHMYTTVLPASLLGNEKVFVRIKAASNKAAASADASVEDGGNVQGSNNMIRFGEVSVQYN